MLQPTRVKYRKVHLHPIRGKATSGNTLVFGDFGLQTREKAWLTSRQIEAARRAIAHSLRRGGKIWVRVFPDRSITKKPLETRMGGGKANPEYWAAAVKPGHILFEIAGVEEEPAREAFRLAGHKLSVATEIVTRKKSGQ